MPSTPNLALPYPALTDPADVPADMKRLADRLDLLLPEAVTSFPASPVDGQEIYYVADATNGVVWHLRYRAASPSTYKWELVGGAPLRAMDDAETSFGTAATLAITLPRAGDYDVWQEGNMWSTGASGTMQIVVNATGVGPSITFATFHQAVATGTVMIGSTARRTIPTAGAALTMTQQLTSGTGTGMIRNRRLTAQPVRVA